MAISTFMRKEIKFMLDMNQYEKLLEEIHKYMDPDKFCVGGKDYGIYNLYYDTPDDYLIRTSLEKPYYKEKIRLRSYFSPAKPDDKVFLEIKKKVGGIVTKRRVTLTLAESDAYLLQRQKPAELTKYLQKQIFSELDVFLDSYPILPKQYISYQRSAFFGKDDPDFRLTFDRNITERRYDLSLAEPSYGAQIIAPNQRLMEVKIADAMPLWLSQKLAELKIYKISFSKYGRAYQRYIHHKLYREGLVQPEAARPAETTERNIVRTTNRNYYRPTAGGVMLP
ncbi:MAG: polyphosphate polymerase domain-containing protein [Oscillospiraceae bacterium]|nr:polyphosphate polymerase domain-containing protein [Oscillospiraceae bacterium]